MTVVAFGGIIYLYRHGHNVSDYSTFKLQPDFTREGWPLLQGVLAFKGRAIIQLGIILLIATPIMRVVFSAIGFFFEKDYLYVLITVLVLGVIMFSMFGGLAGWFTIFLHSIFFVLNYFIKLLFTEVYDLKPTTTRHPFRAWSARLASIFDLLWFGFWGYQTGEAAMYNLTKSKKSYKYMGVAPAQNIFLWRSYFCISA